MDLALPSLSSYLNADPSPSFIIPFDLEKPINFQLHFCNHAFNNDFGLRLLLHSEDKPAKLFRAWCQTVRHWRDLYEFANHSWTAFTVDGKLKAIRSAPRPLEVVPTNGGLLHSPSASSIASGPIDLQEKLKDANIAIEKLDGLRGLDISQVGTFVYNAYGRLLKANKAYYEMSGHPRAASDHVDFAFMDLVYPDDTELVMSKWNTLLQGISIYFEMRWKRSGKDQSFVADSDNASSLVHDEFLWIATTCVPIVDDAGNIICISGNTVDISAQKRIETEATRRAEALERAKASEARFAHFAEIAPIGIFIYDGHKVIHSAFCYHPRCSNNYEKLTFGNEKCFEIIGHPKSPLEDLDWDSHMHPEDVHKGHEAWRLVLDEKRRAALEWRTRKSWTNAEGIERQCWVESIAIPELDSNGNVTRVFGIVNDITRHKDMEDLQRTRIEEALEAKLQKEKYCFCAMLMCLHQKNIVDDVLTLSKLDSNMISIVPTQSQPAEVVQSTLKMFEGECLKEGIVLSFVQDQSLQDLGMAWLMFDPLRFNQILINLLTNAIKFTRTRPIRKIVITLGIDSHRPSDHWGDKITFAENKTISQDLFDNPAWGTGRETFLWVKVEDTGCGLTAKEQSRLFNKFTQANSRTHIKYGGSGLGLFISKSLTELSNGNIGVSSEPDIGTTFAFFISTRISTISPKAHDDTFTDSQYSAESPSSPIRVLIVEDNLVNQKVLSKQLEKAGYVVQIAGHGEEALSFLRTTRFWRDKVISGVDLSVVLMDIEMPVMDGLECARRIRALQKSGELVSHVPIMAVSANARSEQIRSAREAGMDDAIAKPFRIAELLPKIETLARRW
ncbi:hypothetical protein FKW77_002968 [Venturia effusa]|uniref:Histidine kinase n=1 Tax=Venturia effusa TaxID=50376 RepID=A0A517LID1_9PEZI|nr:hypothetical protein FKW77_002968 [Venturia effusa]